MAEALRRGQEAAWAIRSSAATNITVPLVRRGRMIMAGFHCLPCSGDDALYAGIVAARVIVLGIPTQLIYRLLLPSWSTDAEAIEEREDDD